jgi:peptidyl-prolyl cis-trans isomerase D
MLQNIGDKLKSQRWLGTTILGILAVIFALWGAYGIVDLTFGNPSYAAKVNNEEIAATTVQNAWQQRQSQLQQRLQNEIPIEQRKVMQQQLLDDYINETALHQRAQNGGMRASLQQVQDAYRSDPNFQVNGQFSKAAAAAILAQNGTSAAAYDALLRRDLQTTQLIRGIEASNFLTNYEVGRYFALENEQRELRYALLPVARYEAAAKVDDATLAAWHQAHADEYQSAESVRLQYALLSLDELVGNVKVEEQGLKDWFEKNKASYQEPEKRSARHILIQVAKGGAAADDAAARKKAEDVLAQAHAGKDFAKLAEQFSDDLGSKRKGGDLGWSGKGMMVPAFDDALFALQPGQISSVVKTSFGYHIIKLEGLQPAKGKTLEKDRAELEKAYRRSVAADSFGDTQEKLQQRMESSGDSDLTAIAREFHMTSGEIPAYTRAGVPPLGTSTELNNLLFGASAIDIGRLGGPVPVGTERMAIVKLAARQPAALRPLAEVRDQVIAAVRKDAGSRAAVAAAQAAIKSLEGGAGLDAVLKGLGVSAGPAAWVGRGDPQLPVEVRDAAFTMMPSGGKPAYKALPLEAGGAALLLVSAVRPGGQGTNKDNDQQQLAKYLKRMSELELSAYRQELRRTAKLRINKNLFTN